jgi:hypothetical protein
MAEIKLLNLAQDCAPICSRSITIFFFFLQERGQAWTPIGGQYSTPIHINDPRSLLAHMW